MKRDITQLFIEWKDRKNRKPLLIRGARQVGKTYAVEDFARQHYANYVKVNLEEKPGLKRLFVNMDPKLITEELSVVYNTDISPGQTLLFIDEIQVSPEALLSLRYYYEQMPELHVIAAGSLLDHTLNEMETPMPVGRVEFCHMHPMSFMEFLQALGEDKLIDYIERYSFDKGIGQAIHEKALNLLRYYLFIGGMPEAISNYIEYQKLNEIERIQSTILTSFQYDFAKYGSRSQQQHLMNAMKYVGQHPCSRIKYVKIDPDSRAATVKEALHKLELSRIIHRVRHSSSPGVPLSKHSRDDIFKALFLDIGLSNSLNHIQLTDPTKILTINEGSMAEQFAGQELLTLQAPYSDPDLYYWTRLEKSADAEVDFLFQHNNTIYPVEVKAGKTGKLKSLHVYLFEKKLATAIRLNTDLPYLGNFSVKVRSGNQEGKIQYKLLSLPLYLISQIPRLLDSVQQDAG